MEIDHPLDAAIRQWLRTRIDNQSEMSLAVGHSASWLHKYVNGKGTATVDDLLRIAGRLFGMNVPMLTATERKVLKAVQALDEDEQTDLLSYVEHRRKLASRQPPSKESFGPGGHTLPETKHKGRGKR